MSIKEKSENRKKPSHGIYKTKIGCILNVLNFLEGKYLILIYPKSKDTAPKNIQSYISTPTEETVYSVENI